MQGVSKEAAGLIIFFISAVAHEYLISVAIMRASYWAFLGMFAQFVMILVEKKVIQILNLKDTWFGNFSFWCSFCILGQPVLIISYYMEFITTPSSKPVQGLLSLLS